MGRQDQASIAGPTEGAEGGTSAAVLRSAQVSTELCLEVDRSIQVLVVGTSNNIIN